MHIARAYAAMSARHAQLANCTTCDAHVRQGFKESADYFRNLLDLLEKQSG